MENQDLLQAMQAMIKEEISGLRQEMTANNESLRQEMNEKFNDVTEQLDAMQEDIAEIKEDTAITRSATNTLVEWADEVAVITQIKFPTHKAE